MRIYRELSYPTASVPNVKSHQLANDHCSDASFPAPHHPPTQPTNQPTNQPTQLTNPTNQTNQPTQLTNPTNQPTQPIQPTNTANPPTHQPTNIRDMGPAVFSAVAATSPKFQIQPSLFPTIVLERLRLPMQITEAVCECGVGLDRCGRHRAACPRSGRLRSRAVAKRRHWRGCAGKQEQR